jgi:hypothetical protein
MKPNDKITFRESAYLFNVDLLVEGESNAIAMERLMQALNRCGFADFRIKSGVELGKLIAELETHGTAKRTGITIAPPSDDKNDNDKSAGAPAAKEPAKQPQPAADTPLVSDAVKIFIKENRLIRLSVNKGFGVRLSIPCRIINYDESGQILTVYHVDEKQVYTFKLNEIDDFAV